MARENRFWWGAPSGIAGAPSLTSHVINAATDAVEFILQVEEDLICDRIAIRPGAVTGTPGQLSVSLQGVSNGRANGTPLGGGSPASALYTPIAGHANAIRWITL